MGRDKDIPGYRSSGKIHVASRRCTAVPVVPPGGEQITDYSFLRFFVRSVPLFLSLMLTPMLHIGAPDYRPDRLKAEQRAFMTHRAYINNF